MCKTESKEWVRPRFVAMLNELWSSRWLLFNSGVVGLVLATGFAFVIPKRYQSTVQLMPPDSRSSSLSSLAVFASSAVPSALSGPASAILGTKDSGSVFVGILTSRTVQDDLINQFDLRRVYHLRLYRDTRKELAHNSSIGEDKKSGNITIVVTDHDPRRAHGLASAYVDELNRLISQMSTSSARRERIFLEGRLKAVKADLDASSQALGQFSSRNTTIDLKSEGQTMLESAGRIQQELIVAQSELRGLEASYASDNTRIKSAKARVDELRR